MKIPASGSRARSVRAQRRGIAVIASAGLLAMAACGSSSTRQGAGSSGTAARTSITLAESVSNVTDLPIWVAQQKGYFTQHGLNVKVVVLTTSTVTPALVSGSVQYIKDPGFVYVKSTTQGASVEAIAKMDTGLPFAMVVSKQFASKHGIAPSTPLKQVVQDLAGSIGGSTAAGQRGAAKVLFQSLGLNPQYKSATFATVPAMVTAIGQGQIDWFVVAQPIPAEVQAAGNGIVVATAKNAAAWAAQPADMVLATSSSFAKAHPATTKALVAAIDQGVSYVGAHQDQAVSIALSHEQGVTRSEVLTSIQALHWPSSGTMSKSFWSQTFSYFSQAGILPSGASVNALDWSNAYEPSKP